MMEPGRVETFASLGNNLIVRGRYSPYDADVVIMTAEGPCYWICAAEEIQKLHDVCEMVLAAHTARLLRKETTNGHP